MKNIKQTPISKRKVIIISGGDGGYGNLGDEWLLQNALIRHTSNLNNYRIIVLMANPKHDKRDRFEYVEDNYEAFKKLKIRSSDIKLIHYYGGGYINDYWIEEKLWLYYFLRKRGFSEKKFYFTGQGLGPLNKTNIKIIKNIANQAAFFGVRDKTYSQSIGGTFMFDESIVSAPSPYVRKTKKEIFLNIRIANHVGADENIISDIIDKINEYCYLNKYKLKPFIMVQGPSYSEKPHMSSLLLQNGIKKHIYNRPKNQLKLMRKFRRASLVITTSYHATLAGLYSSVPVIALYQNEYYEKKFNGLKESINSPLFNAINISKSNFILKEIDRAISTEDKFLDKRLKNLYEINNNAYKLMEGINK